MTTPNMERRTYAAELRVDPITHGKKTPTIRGYSARFNTLSETMPIIDGGKQIGTFREQLLPGCFADALPTSDVRALINHDPNLILGRNTAGTLRLSEDEVGLRFEIDPPETTCSKDIQVSMQRGDITQCSFGFNVAKGGDTYRKDPDVPGGYIRDIRKISRLFDVSVVTYPAYEDTDCAVRTIVGQMQAEEESAAQAVAEQEEEERLREAESRRRQLDMAEVGITFIPLVPGEQRVSMGYAGYNKVGICMACAQDGCMCPDCPNAEWCNMHTADNGGCCTKMLDPGCCCLQCPNTDKATAKQMWSM